MPDDSRDSETTERPLSRGQWSGMLTFGLVSIPVELHGATRSQKAHLRMLAPDGTPLARRFFCPEHGKELSEEDMVLGYEISEGRYVTVTDEELEAVDPKKSREIDLRQFVPRVELDPLYFERSYFLAPSGETVKAYRLLATVMERTGKAGIATFVMRDREYLVAIFSEGGILRAETLRFHDEVRSVSDVGLPRGKKPAPASLRKLEAAVKALSKRTFDLSRLEDERSQAIAELAEKKHEKGRDVVKGATAEPDGRPTADVIDLMAALRRSLEAKGHSSAANEGKRRSPARPARARTPRAERAPASSRKPRSPRTRSRARTARAG